MWCAMMLLIICLLLGSAVLDMVAREVRTEWRKRKFGTNVL